MRTDKLILAGVSFLILGAMALGQHQPIEAVSAQSPPGDIVEYLVADVSPTPFVSDEVRTLRESIRAQPEKFAEEIVARLGLPSDAATRMPQDHRQRLVRTLWLVTLLGRDVGETAAIELYREATALFDEASGRYDQLSADDDEAMFVVRHRTMGDYVVLRRQALKVLGQFGSPALIHESLETIEREDRTLQLVMLRYFTLTGQGNTDLRARLVEKSTSPSSTLYTNGALAHAITELNPQR